MGKLADSSRTGWRGASTGRPARSGASRLVCLLLLGILAAGCGAQLPARNFVPEALVEAAQVQGLADIRTWGDEARSASKRFIAAEANTLKKKLVERRKPGQRVGSSMLAISGGADDGAFGAGLLVGWQQASGRPEFDLVTGVSAGALIAPFAFLGAEYDRQLGEVFTTYESHKIYQANVLAGILGGPGLASNEPLRRLIEHYVDEALVRRLAEERTKGRLLLVGTTNIDAQRPVYWDLGRIATAGDARSVELIRSVLLASAAIPGFFPPVRIRVTAGGREFEELHVDGGTTREVFYSPADLSFREIDKAVGQRVQRKLYVIRNGKVGPEFEVTNDTALAIGARSLTTVIKNQAIGDLIRMHAKARAEGIDYNLAVIPDTFKVVRPEPFDQGYMRALYQEGLRLGRAGYPWLKSPPGLASEKSG